MTLTNAQRQARYRQKAKHFCRLEAAVRGDDASLMAAVGEGISHELQRLGIDHNWDDGVFCAREALCAAIRTVRGA